VKARIRILTLALLCASFVWPLGAEAAHRARPGRDPFLAQLVGPWDFSGTLRGKPVHYRVEGRWVLHKGWLRLALTDVAKPPAYVAEVYIGFDAHAGDYVAHWLDQFGAEGARVAATGTREGQTLVLSFPYAEGAFRDTLTLAADGSSGSLLIEAQQQDGRWSTFASYTLTRPR
jgi:hypothetical protein